jgi:tRNA A-37 threonylcarbamoyl transferase component Bud32
MKIHIAKEFKHFKSNFLKIISNFDSFDALFDSGNRNTIIKTELDNIIIVTKSFKVPNLINQIVYKYFRKSKAQRSFEYATKLLEQDIKTPKPIAYLEYFSIIGLQKSFYICEFVDCDLTYRDLINNPDYPKREEILRAFTKFTYELHEKGIYFLDHSAGNTLIDKKNDEYNFYLVDLNRMNFGKFTLDERLKNFSRLTPKKEMVEIMSDEYAKLSGGNFEIIFKTMWFYTQEFQEKLYRKRRFKKRFLGKK